MFDIVNEGNIKTVKQLVLSELCMTEAMIALVVFEKTGDRDGFKDWSNKWSDQIEKWEDGKEN